MKTPFFFFFFARDITIFHQIFPTHKYSRVRRSPKNQEYTYMLTFVIVRGVGRSRGGRDVLTVTAPMVMLMVHMVIAVLAVMSDVVVVLVVGRRRRGRLQLVRVRVRRLLDRDRGGGGGGGRCGRGCSHGALIAPGQYGHHREVRGARPQCKVLFHGRHHI